MTLPVYANPISIGQIQTEFGGTNPAAISEYYAGGLYTAAGSVGFPLGVQTAIPTSGVISLGIFHGATASAYIMTPTIVTKNEGDTVTFTITTTGIADSTLYWTTSGTGITTADFNDTVLTGSASLVSGNASFSRTITADNLTEGTEIATFNLHTGSGSGPIVATSVVTINDTSITSSDPTYTLSRSAATVNVGGYVTIQLVTTNVVTGTAINYTITGVTSADINAVPLTGFFTANAVNGFTFSFTTSSSGKTFTLTLNNILPTKTISVGVNVAPGSTQLELANYFWNNRTNLFRSFLSHDGTGSQPEGVTFQATIYPGDASSTGYHENDYSTQNTTVNYHFSDASSCSVNVAKWTTLTWVSGRDVYWNAATPIPVTTPAADVDYMFVLTNPPKAHALSISHVTGDCANAPSNVYTDFHWNNWNGQNNYGVAAYSALIPGGWSIYLGPYTPIGNTGPDNTYFQYDLPSGMISLLIGSDIIDYDVSELSNLEYTGSNTITAAQTWHACSAAILAVNNTGATVPQRMRQSVFTPAYQYYVVDNYETMAGHYEDVPASNAGYGIFADGRAVLIILYKTP